LCSRDPLVAQSTVGANVSENQIPNALDHVRTFDSLERAICDANIGDRRPSVALQEQHLLTFSAGYATHVDVPQHRRESACVAFEQTPAPARGGQCLISPRPLDIASSRCTESRHVEGTIGKRRRHDSAYDGRRFHPSLNDHGGSDGTALKSIHWIQE
jgi:hypothetical protein